ncbi:1-deoxy-D-xylulose-5-phosphate reductoisomerase [Marinivivus vitaminiproducens]|uniref:1-deoxy-D-xylulose-5-phosphate reductoisomerase n=1 Tax=Marinivivus vitaminiproducens TaxID=3035935 RepID=UPI003F9F74C9
MTAPSETAPRSVTILGATGSVGRSTLDLIAERPACYRVAALTAHRNAGRLAELAIAHRARLAVVADPAAFADLKAALAGTGIEAAAGPEAVCQAASLEADWVMAAIVGSAGLAPTLEAVRRGAVIALANKECLVSAGDLFMDEVARCGAVLLPVDSEHNAIFQVLRGDDRERLETIVLTASGGPFRETGIEAMRRVSAQAALAHPVWSMGPKISIDSATLMNKGLELIEASYLFGLPEDRIEVVVHPQSIIHSLVRFADGSVLAQLGQPDMRIPIAYTLGWPERIPANTPRLDMTTCRDLTFEAPDLVRFPALGLARAALRTGRGSPTILNAANEIAVEAFLAGRIGFLEIAATVETTLGRVVARRPNDLRQVAELDDEARRIANGVVARLAAA